MVTGLLILTAGAFVVHAVASAWVWALRSAVVMVPVSPLVPP